jgi:hypothetical protein
MSDERPGLIVIVEVVEPVQPRKIEDHWCDRGCKKSGSFAFTGRCGTEWYCGEHRGDGGH